MTNHQTLKRAAAEAHKLNWTWDRFWQLHADAIRRAEPYDRARYRRLVNRLLSLVVSGDTDGQQAVGDDDGVPWEHDDRQPSSSADARPAAWRTTAQPQPVANPGLAAGNGIGNPVSRPVFPEENGAFQSSVAATVARTTAKTTYRS